MKLLKSLLIISLLVINTNIWSQSSTPTMRQVTGAGTAITRLPATSTATVSATDTMMVFKGGVWQKTTVGSGGMGTVTSVSATSPLSSSGGATPTISITSPLPLANGGTNASITAVIGGVAYSTATTLTITPAGSSGQLMTSNGAAAPSWQTAPSATVTAWGLSGNTGTIAGTNFLGSIDSVDIVFKTKNIERVRVIADSGRVGIGTATPTRKLEVNGADVNNTYIRILGGGATRTTGLEIGRTAEEATLGIAGASNAIISGSVACNCILRADDAIILSATSGMLGIGKTSPSASLHVANTTTVTPFLVDSITKKIFQIYPGGQIFAGANTNLFMGDSVGLKFTTSIGMNTSFGYRAGVRSTTAYENTAIGSNALEFNTSGAFNTAVGALAMKQNTTGVDNVAV